MSVFTAGEIVVWLVLAAALGGVLGWLLASARTARPDSTDVLASPPSRGPSGSSGPIPAATAGGRATRARAGSASASRSTGSPGGAFRGSALPGPGGGSPGPEYVVKANVDSMTFHLPETPTHARVTADVWFKDAEAARAAGFRAPPSQV